MTILLFLFGVAVAAGLFFILADILKLPRLSTEKALLSAGRAEKKRMKSLDAIFLGWAIKLSHFIRMDEYKRHRMERTLSAAGMDMTPEVYLAYTILKPARKKRIIRKHGPYSCHYCFVSVTQPMNMFPCFFTCYPL